MPGMFGLLSCPTGAPSRFVDLSENAVAPGTLTSFLGASLRVGQVVRVVAGPFVGGLGAGAPRRQGRVRLLLNIMVGPNAAHD